MLHPETSSVIKEGMIDCTSANSNQLTKTSQLSLGHGGNISYSNEATGITSTIHSFDWHENIQRSKSF